MNQLLLFIEDINESHIDLLGGKAFSLYRLYRAGFNVAPMVCTTTLCYDMFLDLTGLRERIMLELNRKDFSEMRWEEIWDASLRIRNMFHITELPEMIKSGLEIELHKRFSNMPVVVRSSAPGEDSQSASFAGLHDSYVNISGPGAIIDHIKLVWASLWSDSALLYRKELGLSTEKSAMGVIIQEMVLGDCSGVAFTQNPTDPVLGVIEAVYGLNQGLVDGAVSPDRWLMDRTTRKILGYHPTQRQKFMIPGESGTFLEKLPRNYAVKPPLGTDNVETIFSLAMDAEEIFGVPQDMEWTKKGKRIFLLQSRPISTLKTGKQSDERHWYLSLHKSFENLKDLKNKIENKLIPEMIEIARNLSSVNLVDLSETELISEIEKRALLNQKWTGIYWEDFIPYAHGIRLFGQFYNDTVKPENPYEFIDLLARTHMASTERNRKIEHLASMLRENPLLEEKLKRHEALSEMDNKEQAFRWEMESFVEIYGDLSCPVTGSRECSQGSDALIRLVLEMASHPPVITEKKEIGMLESRFFSSVRDKQKQYAMELLSLGRSSYKLRDDDNIHLGRIESQLIMAINEGKRRLEDVEYRTSNKTGPSLLKETVEKYKNTVSFVKSKGKSSDKKNVQARQLLGQPASIGLARGVARVVTDHDKLLEFKHGEILVCDAVDPNMTYVVPLASGIVERRGGMLIHGAIIAREYGLACVTGVPDATILIQTGDFVTVDGFLGIVTIGKE